MNDIIRKIKSLLTKNQLFGIKILVLLISIGMALEAILLYSLIPLIKLLTDKSYYDDIVLKLEKYDFIRENISYSNFIIFSAIGLIILFFFKNLYLITLTYFQNRFLSNLNSHLSSKLFNVFLSKSYSFFLNKNSSEVIKNFQLDLNYFNALCQSFIMFFVEILLSISVVLTLFYLEPISSIISGILIGISSITYVILTKGYIKRLGDKRNSIENSNVKIISEAINGIKEIKIYNRENSFLEVFKNREFKRAKILTFFNTFNQSPRLIFEIIGISAIMSVILYKTIFKSDQTELFVTVSLFVTATFRLLPSINRIIASLQNINYFKSSLYTIYNLFFEAFEEDHKTENQIFEKNLVFKNVYFDYSKGNPVFRNLNFEIRKGEFIGLMGESGSGKSTFVNLLMGLLKPTNGKILIDGITIDNLYQKRNLTGYISQDIFLFDETIKYNISLEKKESEIDISRVNEVVLLAGLDKFIKSLDSGLDTIVGEKGAKISGGQIKRIGIARALYNDPEILFFDEATVALDQQMEQSFLKEIEKFKGQKTVIFISHNIESLKICDKVYKLENSVLNKI